MRSEPAGGGLEETGGPGLVGVWLVRAQSECAHAPFGEPAGALHKSKKLPILKASSRVHQLIDECNEILGLVSAHGHLGKPKRLLRPAGGACEILQEDLVVLMELVFDLLSGSSIGVDGQCFNDIPAVRQPPLEAGTLQRQSFGFEGLEPATAILRGVWKHGISAAVVFRLGCLSHGRRRNLAHGSSAFFGDTRQLGHQNLPGRSSFHGVKQ
mmetsp:Transcript_146934/g.208312  ORF Transcript_146934/g.208312 Transcript_146934/m.208312 type:complete len:212 (+) Transcript_146934:361-996(+)